MKFRSLCLTLGLMFAVLSLPAAGWAEYPSISIESLTFRRKASEIEQLAAKGKWTEATVTLGALEKLAGSVRKVIEMQYALALAANDLPLALKAQETLWTKYQDCLKASSATAEQAGLALTGHEGSGEAFTFSPAWNPAEVSYFEAMLESQGFDGKSFTLQLGTEKTGAGFDLVTLPSPEQGVFWLQIVPRSFRDVKEKGLRKLTEKQKKDWTCFLRYSPRLGVLGLKMRDSSVAPEPLVELCGLFARLFPGTPPGDLKSGEAWLPVLTLGEAGEAKAAVLEAISKEERTYRVAEQQMTRQKDSGEHRTVWAQANLPSLGFHFTSGEVRYEAEWKDRDTTLRQLSRTLTVTRHNAYRLEERGREPATKDRGYAQTLPFLPGQPGQRYAVVAAMIQAAAQGKGEPGDFWMAMKERPQDLDGLKKYLAKNGMSVEEKTATLEAVLGALESGAFAVAERPGSEESSPVLFVGGNQELGLFLAHDPEEGAYRPSFSQEWEGAPLLLFHASEAGAATP